MNNKALDKLLRITKEDRSSWIVFTTRVRPDVAAAFERMADKRGMARCKLLEQVVNIKVGQNAKQVARDFQHKTKSTNVASTNGKDLPQV